MGSTDDTASFDSVSLKTPRQQSYMFTSRLVVPSAMTWTEKSACVANLPRLHTQTHTRARASCCCCCGVVAVLMRLVVVLPLQNCCRHF